MRIIFVYGHYHDVLLIFKAKSGQTTYENPLVTNQEGYGNFKFSRGKFDSDVDT